MAYIHGLNIVHRDLKPENLLVHRKEDGTHLVKICDFGVSMALDSQDMRLHDSQGTPPFNSPEAWLEGGAEDYSGFTTDVWALGVTLYCFLYQKLPFNGIDDELTTAICTEEVLTT